MVKKDSHTSYADLFGKYFILQGLTSSQNILLISADNNPNNILSNLMGIVEGKSASVFDESVDDSENIEIEDKIEKPVKKGVRFSDDTPQPKRKRVMFEDDVQPKSALNNSNEKLKIAWRYQNLPKVSMNVGSFKPGKNNIFKSEFKCLNKLSIN